jgi:hypothetical protein
MFRCFSPHTFLIYNRDDRACEQSGKGIFFQLELKFLIVANSSLTLSIASLSRGSIAVICGRARRVLTTINDCHVRGGCN